MTKPQPLKDPLAMGSELTWADYTAMRERVANEIKLGIAAATVGLRGGKQLDKQRQRALLIARHETRKGIESCKNSIGQ